MHTYLVYFYSLFLLFAFASCKEESKQPQLNKSLLFGRWEIDQAWRNGRPTETLAGTFYEFTANGTMRTNLTASGVEEEAPFKLNGYEIEQEANPEKIQYSVMELSDSILSLSMQIKNIPFRLRLKKGNLPELTPSTDTLQ